MAELHKKRMRMICLLDATGQSSCEKCAFSNKAKHRQWSDQDRLILLDRQTDRWETLPETASSLGPGKVMPCVTEGFFFCQSGLSTAKALHSQTNRHTQPNTHTHRFSLLTITKS